MLPFWEYSHFPHGFEQFCRNNPCCCFRQGGNGWVWSGHAFFFLYFRRYSCPCNGVFRTKVMTILRFIEGILKRLSSYILLTVPFLIISLMQQTIFIILLRKVDYVNYIIKGFVFLVSVHCFRNFIYSFADFFCLRLIPQAYFFRWGRWKKLSFVVAVPYFKHFRETARGLRSSRRCSKWK